jgi:hypothetical protein
MKTGHSPIYNERYVGRSFTDCTGSRIGCPTGEVSTIKSANKCAVIVLV